MPKGKIGLIIGDSKSPRLAHTFTSLTKDFEVTVYLIQKENILAQVPMPMKAHLFKEEPETPGFLKGAEEHLRREDLLICINIGSLSSLQAARVADESGKPLICYVGDYDLSRYTRYQNLSSIMGLILNKAAAFFIPHAKIAEQLTKAGVDQELVKVISPAVASRFSLSPDKRQKFRQYIGLRDHDLVALYYGNLTSDCRPEAALQALRLQETLNRDLFSRLKIILAGTGELSKDLQYLSYNLGIGQSTYFLSQDTEPFIEDLFSASDLLLCPPDLNQDSLPCFPYHIAEAMACGVVPLAPEGGVASLIAGHPHLCWDGQSYDSLAFAIKRVLGSPESHKTWKRYVLSQLRADDQSKQRSLLLMRTVVTLLDAQSLTRKSSASIPWSRYAKAPATESEAMEIIMGIEGTDFSTLNSEERSRLHLCKGEALRSLLRYEDAFWEFEQSVQWNEKQIQAYCGMGFISWYNYNNEEALTFFKKALSLSPHEQDCMLGIGLVYKRLSMFDDALFWLEKSVSSVDCSDFALKALIQTCNECPEQKRGIDILERVLEAVGDRKMLMTGLGNLYLKAGYVEIAHQIFSRYLMAGESGS